MAKDNGADDLLQQMPDLQQIQAELIAAGRAFEVRTEDVRGHAMPVFANRPRSLGEILETSLRFGDRMYMVDGDVRLSFDDHFERVRVLTQSFRHDLAMGHADRVAIFAANRWDWIVSFWAVVSAGAIPCAFNGWWTEEEFRHAVELVNPTHLITDRPRLERVGPSSFPGQILNLDADLQELLDRDASGDLPVVRGDEDETALILFTSGTTGRPRAVTIPHRSIVGFAQVNLFRETVGRVAQGAPIPERGDLFPSSDDVHLVTSPLFHVSMLHGAVVMSICRGSCIVLLPGRFDPERVLQTIEKERVTSWSALGSAAPKIATCPALAQYDTSSIRLLGIGGAPVSPTVQQRLREAFPKMAAGLSMGYTSTEAGAVIASNSGPEFVAHPGSTGRITVTTQVELRDENGDAVLQGSFGEVHVRSPYIMLGYWNDADASSAVLKAGGWLAMGDVARIEDGLLYIDARARDMILVSAENVSPTEVEHVLEAHPDVREAAVLAVDDKVTGDAVCAVVVTDVGNVPDPDRLAAWCRASLAHYKVPTQLYVVHDALPRTPSGKLVKHAIRLWIDNGAAQPTGWV
jgi:long-chain acyl-CoA synthetase